MDLDTAIDRTRLPEIAAYFRKYVPPGGKGHIAKLLGIKGPAISRHVKAMSYRRLTWALTTLGYDPDEIPKRDDIIGKSDEWIAEMPTLSRKNPLGR